MSMSGRRRNKNKLPNPKDPRIAELEEKLTQVLEVNQTLQKELGGETEETGTQGRTGKVCASSHANDQTNPRDEDRQAARLS
jgi:hypothetical protein